MIARWRRAVAWAVALATLASLALIARALLRAHPEDLPWTPLDLSRPIGAFTGRKLAALADDPPRCRATLRHAGIAYATLPPRVEGATCGYHDGVRLTAAPVLRPAGPPLACPLAAGLVLWWRDVVQPAAWRHYHRSALAIDHYGSYSCRRLYGRAAGAWSEHARADALDVAGIRLAGGRRVTVASGWASRRDAAFLHEIRDGGCRLFATVLSPDYNAAHHDHLHLDQAARGALGWRACR